MRTISRRHGLRCWIAPRDVRAGREYANEIIDAIERTPVLVLVLSAAANESKFVRREVERAVTKGDPVIPVRIENVMPSTALELFVSATHWIDAWRGDCADHMDRLVRDLASGHPPADIAYVSRERIGDGSGNARRVLSGAGGRWWRLLPPWRIVRGSHGRRRPSLNSEPSLPRFR